MSAPTTFSQVGLDRAEAARRDPGWVRERWADPRARVVVAGRDGVGVRDGRAALLPTGALDGLAAAGEPVLLGLDDGAPRFAVDVDAVGPAACPVALTGLRDAAGVLPAPEAGLLGYASALVAWHRRSAFCAACGARTEVHAGGHERHCPRCGAHHHPRVDPVVIMLVVRGDACLLGRQPSWPPQRYSALAGFVSPGESLEEAVAREVREEAGVEVAEVRYRASQPWPFPGSLMLGFTATWTAGEARVADDELEDVRWFTRRELREEPARGRLDLPGPVAIARRLIDGWLPA